MCSLPSKLFILTGFSPGYLTICARCSKKGANIVPSQTLSKTDFHLRIDLGTSVTGDVDVKCGPKEDIATSPIEYSNLMRHDSTNGEERKGGTARHS